MRSEVPLCQCGCGQETKLYNQYEENLSVLASQSQHMKLERRSQAQSAEYVLA